MLEVAPETAQSSKKLTSDGEGATGGSMEKKEVGTPGHPSIQKPNFGKEGYKGEMTSPRGFTPLTRAL